MNVKLPDGYILKNSCKPLHGFKYNHPFDGHGLINRFKIQDNKIMYKGIRVKTEQYQHERKCGKMLYRGLNTNVPNNPFLIENFSNISIFEHDGEVQSISEGGMPYVIDVEKGETIGRKFQFVPPLIPYFPISALPKIDNGRAINFSCLMNGFVLFNDKGIILNEIFPDFKQYYFHDFAITDKYYIFYMNNTTIDLKKIYTGGGTILDGFSFNKGNKVLLVNKKTLKRDYYEMPTYYDQNALHIGIAEEEGDTVKLYMSFIPDKFKLAEIPSAHDFKGCYLHRLDVNTKTKNITATKLSGTSGEMPVATEDGKLFLINEHFLTKYDTKSNRLMTKRFEDQIIEEPVVKDNKLFLIGHKENETILSVLDTDTLEILYTEIFSFQIPYGFHGIFLSM
mgnify:FL=1